MNNIHTGAAAFCAWAVARLFSKSPVRSLRHAREGDWNRVVLGLRLKSLWLGLFVPIMAAAASCGSSASDRHAHAVVPAQLSAALDRESRVPVIVTLREPSQAYAHDRLRRAQAIAVLHTQVLSFLGADFEPARTYRHTPAFAGRIGRAGLQRLMQHPSVVSVQIDHRGRGQLMQAVPAVHADQVHNRLKITGKGVRVAVLDSGIDKTHPDLADALVAEHCFTRGRCPPLQTMESDSAQDDNGHGTSVTGAIASRGRLSAPGFAPEAEIIAVKVLDADATGKESDWVAGLDWIYDNLATLRVSIVNLSFVTEEQYADGTCDTVAPALAQAIDNLVRAGVAVIGASGNGASSTALSVPACNTGVIAVGASYDSDVGPMPPDRLSYRQFVGPNFADCQDAVSGATCIACFTNSSPRLDLIAPGAPITSDWLGDATSVRVGTSYAAAAVAGVSALMLQCRPGLSPAELKRLLHDTGTPLQDPRNDLSIPLVQAFDAVRAACPGIEQKADPSADPIVPPSALGPLDAGASTVADAAVAMPTRSAPMPSTQPSEVSAPAMVADAGGHVAVQPAARDAVVTDAAVTDAAADLGAGARAPALREISLPDDQPKRGSLVATRTSKGCACFSVGRPRSARAVTCCACLLAYMWLGRVRRQRGSRLFRRRGRARRLCRR